MQVTVNKLYIAADKNNYVSITEAWVCQKADALNKLFFSVFVHSHISVLKSRKFLLHFFLLTWDFIPLILISLKQMLHAWENIVTLIFYKNFSCNGKTVTNNKDAFWKMVNKKI